MTYAQKYGHRKIVATDGQKAVEAYKQACLESVHRRDGSPPIVRNDSGNDSVRPEDVERLEPPIKPQAILMDINMPVW